MMESLIKPFKTGDKVVLKIKISEFNVGDQAIALDQTAFRMKDGTKLQYKTTEEAHKMFRLAGNFEVDSNPLNKLLNKSKTKR